MNASLEVILEEKIAFSQLRYDLDHVSTQSPALNPFHEELCSLPQKHPNSPNQDLLHC